MEKELVGLAVLLAQAVLLLLQWRRSKDGKPAEHHDEDRRNTIAADIALVNSYKIEMPANWRDEVLSMIAKASDSIEWQTAIRNEARHEISNSVMLTAAAINAVKAPDSIDEYRRDVISHVVESFNAWMKSRRRDA